MGMEARIGSSTPMESTDFVAVLRTCTKTKDLCRGIRVHDDIQKHGLLGKCSDALVTMYAKCGALKQAKALFDTLKVMNVFTWTALIAGYAEKGQGHAALHYFDQMQQAGLSPDAVTFTCILKACGTIGALGKGEKIHDAIVKQGLLRNNIVLGSALVDMYGKCGALAKAQHVLEELSARNVISWTALITGYVQQGHSAEALECFSQMQLEGFSPNALTFSCILKACASMKALNKGEEVHHDIAKLGLLGMNVVLGTALVDMYAKCGALAKARQVIKEIPMRDVISWNALISGYVEHGEGDQALDCYEKMRREALFPNEVTYICILKACGSIGVVEKGEQIHEETVEKQLLASNIVLGTSLVDMYAKCGALPKAHKLLKELTVRDIFCWNALITGYAHKGKNDEALDCFEQMMQDGISPDAVTFLCILKVCGGTGAVYKGEELHDIVAKQGLLANNVALNTALMDMYAKCGAIAKAYQVLENFPIRDIISWNALMTSYSEQCNSEKSLQCFEQMQGEGLSPDTTTFSCMLSACSRLGLAEDARSLFVKMSTNYGLEPDLEHFTCLVDLFGRAGHLDMALRLIERMPSPDGGVWSALLGACQKSGDVNVGRWAFQHLAGMDNKWSGSL